MACCCWRDGVSLPPYVSVSNVVSNSPMRQETIPCFGWAVVSGVSESSHQSEEHERWCGEWEVWLLQQAVSSSAHVHVSSPDLGFDHLKMNPANEELCEQASRETVLALSLAQKSECDCMLGGRKRLGLPLLFAVSQPNKGPVPSPLHSLLLILALGWSHTELAWCSVHHPTLPCTKGNSFLPRMHILRNPSLA